MNVATLPAINNDAWLAHYTPLPAPAYFVLNAPGMPVLALAKHYRLLIELGSYDAMEEELAFLRNGAPDFALSLTTRGAAYANMAAAVAQAIGRHFRMDGDQQMRMASCLQEALTNAMVHGNLCLKERPECTRTFDHYYQHIEALIESEPYASRRIRITAWRREGYSEIYVSDEGDGIPAAIPQGGILLTAKSGRGLQIIHALADSVGIGEDRRTLCMGFSL
jgi:anti-sigma regulatory factor (Ser/Thr protein kinase)